MFDVTQSSGHTIHASHLEAPREQFFLQFDTEAYNNILGLAPGRRWVRVLAETAAGALKIAKYHYGAHGSNFELLPDAPTRGDLISPISNWDHIVPMLKREESPSIGRSSCLQLGSLPCLLESPPCRMYSTRKRDPKAGPPRSTFAVDE